VVRSARRVVKSLRSPQHLVAVGGLQQVQEACHGWILVPIRRIFTAVGDWALRYKLAAIVDLEDGGFELRANPRGFQVRAERFVRWGIPVLALAGIGVTTYVMVLVPAQWKADLALMAFLGGGALVCWFSFQPPVVRVTGAQVVVPAWPTRQRIARSDLASIFRGQGTWGRYKAWTPLYFLVTQDGTPQIALLAESFTDEGMADLAKRLQVPIQGDFTTKVR
jgi:hypothetical protein